MKVLSDRYKPEGAGTSGGMGDVAYFRDKHLNRRVVIKTLKDGTEARRLVDEMKALTLLRSKHVVQLYDIVETVSDKGVNGIGIVLEYIEGKDFEVGSLCADYNYLRVLWQVACGIRDIHSHSIVHRDIKPNNIRVDEEGVVKIMDFGLARTYDQAKTGSIIGTPIFMAPELWGGAQINFTDAVDVYAFGVTCLALLSNHPPANLTARPPLPVALSDVIALTETLPIEVPNIIHRCLELDAKLRPSMDEIVETLKRQLTKDKHKALITMGNTTHTISKDNRQAKISVGNIGSLSIQYDGLNFLVTGVNGDVSFNNLAAEVGQILPGCCVITFKGNQRRVFVTFDVSHPEVTA